jgi:hypothetical protein
MIAPYSKAISCRNVAEPLDVPRARRDRDPKEHGVILFRCDETDGYRVRRPPGGVVVDEHGLALGDGQGKTDIVAAVWEFWIPELDALWWWCWLCPHDGCC